VLSRANRNLLDARSASGCPITAQRSQEINPLVERFRDTVYDLLQGQNAKLSHR
jgi:hypothetical protein